MLPLNSLRLVGLMVTQGDVSVKPYASRSGDLVTSIQCSATIRCTAIPPPNVKRNLEKSNFAKFEFLVKALNKVFTPVIAVNAKRFISLIMRGTSRGLVISTFKPPILVKNMQLAVKEKI